MAFPLVGLGSIMRLQARGTVKLKTDLTRPLSVRLLWNSAMNAVFSSSSGAVSGSCRGGCSGFTCEEVG